MAEDLELVRLISDGVERAVARWRGATPYRPPLIGFAEASDPRFEELRRIVCPAHMLPGDLLEGARSVVSFFLPFDGSVTEANARDRAVVAREWAVGYVETNALIKSIAGSLTSILSAKGVRASSEPPTGRFDRTALRSSWSHKSVAVIAGLGSFGVHRMVITDAGCAGRFGSLVIDADLGAHPARGGGEERCLHLRGQSCLACVRACPVRALTPEGGIDRRRCWERCQAVADDFRDLGAAEVCGKCALGPCSLTAPR